MKKFFKSKYLFLFILFLALVLRFISLNQSFWIDEATSGYIVRDLDYKMIISKFSPGDFNPPLYYLFLKLWSGVFGTGEVGLRSLSVVTGVATIYIVYLCGEKIFNKNIALLSSLFLATSGLHIYYSQETRMYVLTSFFVLLTIYFFIKTAEPIHLDSRFSSRWGRVGNWLLFGVFLVASVTTHYQALFMIPVYWIYGVLRKFKLSWWKKFIASHIILIFFLIAWFPILSKQLAMGTGIRSSLPNWWSVLGSSGLKELFLVPVKFILGRISFENNVIFGMVSVITGLLFGYLILRVLKIKEHSKQKLLIYLWLILPVFIGFVVGFKLHVFSYFRFLYVLPAFYILVALGVLSFQGRIRTLMVFSVLLINLITTLIYLSNPKFHREDWRGLIKKLQPATNNKDSLVVFPSNTGSEAFRYYDPEIKINILVGENISSDYDIIWLMRYAQPIFDPDDNVRKSVETKGYLSIQELDFNGVVVWKYTKL